MPTVITTINASDLISGSRTDINNNFSSLNTNKIETSVIDTDTSLAANSDARIPSQKAVKAYVDTGGNVNATISTRGIVEVATQAEVNAGTPTGGTGASLIVTPETLKGSTNPVRRTYGPTATLGGATTRFDISNPAGNTFRYTYDGTGTDPGISASIFPIGSRVTIYSRNFSTANNGTFTVTGSGTNYFEVTNASGVAETDKDLGDSPTGVLFILQTTTTWTKPAGLKYIEVELVGGGAMGVEGRATSGGGAGGYSRKRIAAASLSGTETVTVGTGGILTSKNGGTSSFGAHLSATGGTSAVTSDFPGPGGVGSSGDHNLRGGMGEWPVKENNDGSNISGIGGKGGSSFFAQGGIGGYRGASAFEGKPGAGWGAAGGGSGSYDSDSYPGYGFPGMVTLTEYYS